MTAAAWWDRDGVMFSAPRAHVADALRSRAEYAVLFVAMLAVIAFVHLAGWDRLSDEIGEYEL